MAQDTAKDWEDVRAYTLDESDEIELLKRQTECTFIWSNKEGHPLGVIVNFIFRNGSFWLTATEMRPRVAAIRRDPRVSIAVTSKGSGIEVSKSLTYKGHAVVHTDEEIMEWFVPDFSTAMRPDSRERAQGFAEHLRSPGRVVVQVIPEKRIGYDAAKMWAAAPSASPLDEAKRGAQS